MNSADDSLLSLTDTSVVDSRRPVLSNRPSLLLPSLRATHVPESTPLHVPVDEPMLPPMDNDSMVCL